MARTGRSRRPPRAAGIALAGVVVLPAIAAEGGGCVLVFSRTAGFRHASQIPVGITTIEALGAAHGFTVDATEDSGAFTAENLAQYMAVVFLNTTGDVLDPAQESALESYVTGGGGFVGIHSASDTEHGWPFYATLVGALFERHPSVQRATLHVLDDAHRSTAHLPPTFSHTDEWYDFATDPADDPSIRVLLTLDETSYDGGAMGASHPVAWCRTVGDGRSWYTALGHTVFTYDEPFFRQHVLGGIEYAVSVRDESCPADLDGSGGVDRADLSRLLRRWGPGAATRHDDLDGDGAVDLADLTVLLHTWGPCR